MKKFSFYFIVLIIQVFGLSILKAQNSNELELWLTSIDGLTFTQTPLDSTNRDAYTIFIEQPIDHQNPNRGKFLQKIYLIHKSSTLPTVMVTEGYSANRNYLAEPTRVIDANQLIVEHRFFGESVPDSLDWSQLTTANAAADHHRIFEIFSQFYTNKWISTGISKGGQTTIFYKYYYPNDMDICMPYVAPLNLEQEDVRINWFLRHVGKPVTQARILKYQRLMLTHFDSIFPLFQHIAQSNEAKFAVNDSLAYEFMVLEFPFSFWQWGSYSADSIPSQFTTPLKMMKPMIQLGLINFYFQSTVNEFMPFMVQAYRELGYYNYDLDSLQPYLRKMTNSSNIAFVPEELRFDYDPNIMKNIFDFIQNHGNHMIYIYGELDPWSSTSLVPDARVDAIKLVLPGGSHATRLHHFSKEKQAEIKNQLNIWLKE